MKEPERIFRYLLRLGVQVALLAIGGGFALGIYYAGQRMQQGGRDGLQRDSALTAAV